MVFDAVAGFTFCCLLCAGVFSREVSVSGESLKGQLLSVSCMGALHLAGTFGSSIWEPIF